MWKEHGICDLLWFNRWFASNLKWCSSKQVLRLTTILLTSWQELSFKKLFDFPFSMLQMDVYTPRMWNSGIENQVHWLMPWPSFEIFLFKWKWILINLWGFIDLVWQNNFSPQWRYGMQKIAGSSWAWSYLLVRFFFWLAWTNLVRTASLPGLERVLPHY